MVILVANKNPKLLINNYKYFIGVLIFLVFALVSIVPAMLKNDTQLVNILLAVLGYFAFIVVDHIELAAAVERFEATLSSLSQPINYLQSQKILEKASTRGVSVEILSGSDAMEYALTRVKSAVRMYNTSLSDYESVGFTRPYEQWLSTIVDAVTDQDCRIREVMISSARLDKLKELYGKKAIKMQGYYIGFIPNEENGKDYLKYFRCIPEFSIFEDQDGNREVIFGWTTSDSDYSSMDCFVIKDRAIVDYFKSQFGRYEALCAKAYLESDLSTPRTELNQKRLP
jgi:hypothetical protein